MSPPSSQSRNSRKHYEEIILRDISVELRSGPIKGEERRLIVSDVNFRFVRGRSYGIVGESGSGKSLTWLAALGAAPKSLQVSGDIILDGEVLSAGVERAVRRIRGSIVATVPQDPLNSLNPARTVGWQLTEALKLHRGLDEASARHEAVHLLEAVSLPKPRDRLSAYPRNLSGGQCQRVLIAMALAGQPDFIVADEPTTALDISTQFQILKTLRDVRNEFGTALILISHDLHVVGENCEEIYVMSNGRVVEHGSPEQIFRKPTSSAARALVACSNSSSLSQPLADESQPLQASIGLKPRAKPLVKVRGCSFTYEPRHSSWLPLGLKPKKRDSSKILNKITFDIDEERTIGIVGESGSGKSTVAKLLLNEIVADEGMIWRDGDAHDVNLAPPRGAMAKLMQLVSQDPYGALDPSWPVGRQIEEPLEIHVPSLTAIERKYRSVEIMAHVGLSEEFYGRLPSMLSGGQCQRIALARALITQPKVIVCDEVTSALDVTVQQQVVRLLKKLQKKFNISYVFISHDLRLVSQIADEILVMHQGEIVERGEPRTLFGAPQHSYTKGLIDSLPQFQFTGDLRETDPLMATNDLGMPTNRARECA